MKNFLLLILILCSAQRVVAQDASVRENTFNTKKNVALSGYDPVSYFSGKPLEGNLQWQHTYLGITYLFANKANLEKFKSNPAIFEPQFGGWCAYAIGDSGEKVKVDPKTYKIRNGKLYLFYNFRGINTLELWNKAEPDLLQKAKANWEKIIE
jgi:YHS domain-containing protein